MLLYGRQSRHYIHAPDPHVDGLVYTWKPFDDSRIVYGLHGAEEYSGSCPSGFGLPTLIVETHDSSFFTFAPPLSSRSDLDCVAPSSRKPSQYSTHTNSPESCSIDSRKLKTIGDRLARELLLRRGRPYAPTTKPRNKEDDDSKSLHSVCVSLSNPGPLPVFVKSK